MTGKYHNPVIQRNSLYGSKFLMPAIYIDVHIGRDYHYQTYAASSLST